MVRSGRLGEFLPFATEAVYFPLSAALLFLYCFADGKPKYINVDGTKYFYINNILYRAKCLLCTDQIDNVTPEKFASSLSRLVFAWMDALTYRGWKTKLEPEVLWGLQRENRSFGAHKRIFPHFVLLLYFVLIDATASFPFGTTPGQSLRRRRR